MKFKLNIIWLTLLLISFHLISCKYQKSIHSLTDTKSINSKEETVILKKQYATKLGVLESDIKNEKLYLFINEWYGVPYKYAGKDKKGIDCSGLASALYLNVYQKKIASSTKTLVDEITKIKESDLKEGDLLFFKIDSEKISHVGVYLKNKKFLHASTKKGVMISDLNEPYFKKYFFCAGKIK